MAVVLLKKKVSFNGLNQFARQYVFLSTILGLISWDGFKPLGVATSYVVFRKNDDFLHQMFGYPWTRRQTIRYGNGKFEKSRKFTMPGLITRGYKHASSLYVQYVNRRDYWLGPERLLIRTGLDLTCFMKLAFPFWGLELGISFSFMIQAMWLVFWTGWLSFVRLLNSYHFHPLWPELPFN